MAIIGDGRGGVFCENSLQPPAEWQAATSSAVGLGRFDVVLTNPPFGAQIKVDGKSMLSQYDLGYKWKRNKESSRQERTSTLHEFQPPQILFLERCLQFLKPAGRLGIVLPESIVGSPSYEYVVTFLMEHAEVLGVVTLPEALFKTSGSSGTHTKVCVLFLEKRAMAETAQIFMADVKWCGHDSRGNPTVRRNSDGEYVLLDEVPLVADRYIALKDGKRIERDHLGFYLQSNSLRRQILVPKYYNPEIEASLKALESTHRMHSLGELVDDGSVSITTGIEIGKMAYGTGTIPFIRTSDLSNWELKADFKHGVSEEIYEEAKRGCDVQAGDILMVRDGTYLIGTAAFVTQSDLPMLFQSHLLCIRVLKPQTIDPYLLFVCLNAPIVKAQIRSKQFTQDIIDTLGNRALEIALPIPKDARHGHRLALRAKEVIDKRAQYREEAKLLPLQLQGKELPAVDEDPTI